MKGMSKTKQESKGVSICAIFLKISKWLKDTVKNVFKTRVLLQ